MTKNIIAVAILVVLGVAAYLVFRERPDAEQQAAAAVLEPVPLERLDTLEIIRHEGSGSTLREEVIVLAKAGDEWRMQKPVDYAVNPTSVERMTEVLAELKVVDAIAENQKRHHVLEVDDELGIEVTASAGDEVLAHFIVGVTRDNMTYVRLPGSDTVYRITGSHRPTFNKSVKNLRDKSVFKLDKNSVTKMTFTNEHGELEIAREGEGDDVQFVPVGQEIQNFHEQKARGIAGGLTGLTTRDFADEDPGPEVTGLGDDAAKVVFEATADGKPGTYTLWVGNEIEKERQTYLKTSLSDQIFRVSSHMVKRFKAQASDFARTDEQLAQEEERRKQAELHRKKQEAAAKLPPGVMELPQGAMGGQPGSQQIPPEVMKQLREQMAKQGKMGPPPGKQAGDGHDHGSTPPPPPAPQKD